MVYETLTQLFRKHLYIVFSEKFQKLESDFFVERFVAKHGLLKPELIVVNDLPHGFKRVGHHVASLELFPIYAEIEYFHDDEEGIIVDHVDLYAEGRMAFGHRMGDLKALAEMFSPEVTLDVVSRVNDQTQDALVICSRLNDQFMELELSGMDQRLRISQADLAEVVETHILRFVEFIRCVDELLVKGHSFAAIKASLK